MVYPPFQIKLWEDRSNFSLSTVVVQHDDFLIGFYFFDDLKVSYLVIKSIFVSPNPSEPLNPDIPEANLIEFTDL